MTPANARTEAIRHNHEELLDLCGQLETIADSLPFELDHELCREVADRIVPVLTRTQTVEELVLYPFLEESAGSCFSAMTIDRLKGEHMCDRIAAEEVALTLEAVLDNRCGLTFETVGYMLRGFFECLRRHVAAERSLIEMFGTPDSVM
ncbi:hemerythrin domain-containing protein [Ciceribacter thiooxidans]|uniref:Hemerythrin domain-containing protein n=1 Tax=Ciceribacter thiooxidans TaxID=1969821 RepID=A0ABV7HXS5_9HYPH|nr:hemerythrin domain-containing protein [Ciceribacter thiooxidans]